MDITVFKQKYFEEYDPRSTERDLVTHEMEIKIQWMIGKLRYKFEH